MAGITLTGQTSGSVASGTTATITLPTYNTGDFLVLVLSRNQAQSSPFGVSADLTGATEIANSNTRRLTALRLIPNGKPTQCTLTASTSGAWAWWVAAYSGVDATASIASATNPIGNSSVSAVAIPVTTFDYVATGNELAISAAGVNSTATWTTNPGTIYRTTANNAAMMVDTGSLTAGSTARAFTAMDRGSNGTARNQNSLSFALQTTPNGFRNLLAYPSFEVGGTLATSWQNEGNTAVAPAYSLTANGVVDGSLAQTINYSGQSGDNNSKFEIFQSPIAVNGGDVLTLLVSLSGSMTNVYGIVGIEAFKGDGTYLSEQDTSVTSLSSTPTPYSATYVCPPGTAYCAAYIQIPGIVPSSAVTINIDRATLTKAYVDSRTPTVTLGTSSAGTKAAPGTAAGTLPLTGATAGSKSAARTVASNLALGSTTAGLRRALATVAAQLALRVTGLPLNGHLGTAAPTLALGTTAAGQRRSSATALAVVPTLTASASGLRTRVLTVLARLALTAATLGLRPVDITVQIGPTTVRTWSMGPTTQGASVGPTTSERSP